MVILMAATLSTGFTSCGEEFDFEKNYNEYEEYVDDDGVPQGSPGTEDMFGYYSMLGTNGEMWQSFKTTAADNVSRKIVSSYAWDNLHSDFSAFRIVDSKTIYHVFESIYITESMPSDNKGSLLLESEHYNFKYNYSSGAYATTKYANYYLCHYIGTEPLIDDSHWEGRYAMNGSTMTVHTDETTKWIDGKEYVAVGGQTYQWSYSNGVITVTNANGSTTKYVKVK